MARMRSGNAVQACSSRVAVYSLLVQLAVLLATHVHLASAAVTYKVTNTVPGTPGGRRFNQEVGVANMRKALQSAAEFCRGTAFSLSAPKSIATVTLIVENFEGVAFTAGSTIHLSASYVQGYAPHRLLPRLDPDAQEAPLRQPPEQEDGPGAVEQRLLSADHPRQCGQAVGRVPEDCIQVTKFLIAWMTRLWNRIEQENPGDDLKFM
jgi:hypothetical protein